MTKKGPLSKSEKQYIEDNRELPVGEIAEELASIANDFPNAQIGSYPFKKNLVKRWQGL